MSRFVTATLVKHSTEDGLVTMWEHVPLGKQYQVDLDTIQVMELIITDPKVPDNHPTHRKEVIFADNHQWLATECLHIPGHESKRIYTHKDKDGVLWRFEGGRPISQIADEFMDEFGFNEK